jgi:hypothetical protein
VLVQGQDREIEQMMVDDTSASIPDKQVGLLRSGIIVSVLLVTAGILVPSFLSVHSHEGPPISKNAELFFRALNDVLAEVERTQGNRPHDATSLQMFLSERQTIRPFLQSVSDVIDTTQGEVLIKWRESSGEAVDIAYLHNYDAISCLSLRWPSE